MTAFQNNAYSNYLGRFLAALSLLAAVGTAGATAAELRLAQNSTQIQTEANELPSLTVGPPPASKSPIMPTIIAPKVGTGEERRRSTGAPPKSLKLHLDPKTGQPLTPGQLKNRDRQSEQTPRPLHPRQPEKPAATPVAGVIANPGPRGNVGENTAANAGSGGIQVKALGRAKLSAIGLLNEADGGFGNGMWSGTPLPLVMGMLPRLPIVTASPLMQSLNRRLLLTTALPPDDAGAGSGGADGDDDGSALVALRIERLAAAGNSEAVAQLLKFAPLSSYNGIFAHVRVEAELLAGNVRQACSVVRNQIGASVENGAAGSGVIWQKVMAFCLALDGQSAQVELYEQLLYENGVEDEAFFTLLAGLSSGEVLPLESVGHVEPLHLAMLRAARRAIPADAVEKASPAVLRAIATSPNAALDMRLEAAEQAETLGALPTEVLRRIYASVPFTAEQSADSLMLAKSQPGPSASAILYQVAQIDVQVESRARVLAAAWRNGGRTGRYMTAVRVNLPITRSIKPDANLAWFAAPAGRALLAAGDTEAARAWLMAVVEPARAGQPEAAAAVLALAPLIYIRDAEQNFPTLAPAMEKVMAGWWQGEVANNSTERYQRGLRLFGLLTALGKDVSGKLWLPLFEAPDSDILQASPSLLMGLDRAAASGRTGEVVLLSLLLLGERGPSVIDTIALGKIVSALRRVGLEEDASALALEGLLGAGF